MTSFVINEGLGRQLQTILGRGVTRADVDAAIRTEAYLRGVYDIGPGIQRSPRAQISLDQAYNYRKTLQVALTTKELRDAVTTSDKAAAAKLVTDGVNDGSLRLALRRLSSADLEKLGKVLPSSSRSQLAAYLSYQTVAR